MLALSVIFLFQSIFDLTSFSTALGIASVLVGIATVYLRLFTTVELQKLENRMLDKIEQRFTQKQLNDEKLEQINQRMSQLEEQRRRKRIAAQRSSQ